MQGSANGPVYAALITSTLSFIGVVVGFVWNGKLQRNADNRKFEAEIRREELQRGHDRRVLRATLLAELSGMSRAFRNEIRFVKSKKFDFTWVPLVGFFDSSFDTLKKVGLLTSDEVSRVMDAYYTYQEHIGYIQRNGQRDPDDVLKGLTTRNIGYPLTDEEKRDWLLDSLQKIVGSVGSAIAALKKAGGAETAKRGDEVQTGAI